MKTKNSQIEDGHASPKEINESAIKCLRKMAHHHGKVISLVTLRAKNFVRNEALTLNDMAKIAESIGFRAHCVTISLEELGTAIALPCIIKWNGHGVCCRIGYCLKSDCYRNGSKFCYSFKK